MSGRAYKRLFYLTPVIVGAVLALAGKGCNDNQEPIQITTDTSSLPSPSPSPSVALSKAQPKPDIVTSASIYKDPSGNRPLYKIFDFATNLNQAHLRSQGIFIDFGTQSRHKHTLGDWKSGFGGDLVQDKVSFTYMVSNVAQIYFDVFPDELDEGTLIIRARAQGSKEARLYLNDKYVGTVHFETQKFAHGIVDFKNLLKPGQNQLTIRCDSSSAKRGSVKAALAIDYVRVAPSRASNEPAVASVAALLYPDATGGPDGLVLSDNESLTYNLPIPEGAHIIGQARVRANGSRCQLNLVARDDSKNERILFNREIDEHWSQFNVDLPAKRNEALSLTITAYKCEVVLRNAGLYAEVAGSKPAPGETRAKNFVLVLIDTLRADKLELYNKDTRVKTSFITRLGSMGMVFRKVLAPENWTKPSVASLLTGLFPTTHTAKDAHDKLPSTVPLASEHLSLMGFDTAAFIANGYVSQKFGFKKGWNTWTNYVREGKPNRAEFVFKDAEQWLEKRTDDRPFFLYVHTIDPHVPYIPPKRYVDLYDNLPYRGPVKPRETAKLLERIKTGGITLSPRDKIHLEALYDAEISYHDDSFVHLYDMMKELGLLEDTLIIVTSDHGEEFFEHGLVGHGHSLYEELLHVPLIVKLPGGTENRMAENRSEISLVDVLPTAYEILGVEKPQELEGVSLVPLLGGKRWCQFPDASFAEYLEGHRAVRSGRYKLVYKGLKTTLFDLETDPRETTDMSSQKPVALATMRDLMGKHLGRFIHTFPEESEGKTRKQHSQEKTKIDSKTRRQLQALGYLGGE